MKKTTLVLLSKINISTFRQHYTAEEAAEKFHGIYAMKLKMKNFILTVKKRIICPYSSVIRLRSLDLESSDNSDTEEVISAS